MQDLFDTLRDREALFSNMDNPSIVDASGKETLDDQGNRVGLTVTLLDATVGFATRPGPEWTQCYLSGGNLAGRTALGVVTTTVTHNNPYVNLSKTSSVSATFSESSAIQFASYGNIVTVDPINGVAGTAYPIGTQQLPVNNLNDAKVIALTVGLDNLHIHGDYEFPSNAFLAGYKIYGDTLL